MQPRGSALLSSHVAEALPLDGVFYWLRLGAMVGSALLACGLLFFFAYNWDLMHRFVKLGLLLVSFSGALGIALFCGVDSLFGKAATFFGSLVLGGLLATFGQIYQTGADSVDLFRAWALLLLPLALAARQNAVWCVLWTVATIWGVLWCLPNSTASLFSPWWVQSVHMRYVIAAQCGFLVLWERAYHVLKDKAGFAWLQQRWFPRLMAFVITQFILLNFLVILYNDDCFTRFSIQGALYSAMQVLWLLALWLWYRWRQPDVAMLFVWAYGVFSLSTGLLVRFLLLDAHLFRQFLDSFLLMLFVAACLIAVLCVLATYMRHCQRVLACKLDHKPEIAQQRQGEQGENTFGMTLFLGFSSWVCSLFLGITLFLLHEWLNPMPIGAFLVSTGLCTLFASRYFATKERKFLQLLSLPWALMGACAVVTGIFFLFETSFFYRNSTGPMLLITLVLVGISCMFPHKGIRMATVAGGCFSLLFEFEGFSPLLRLLPRSVFDSQVWLLAIRAIVLVWNCLLVYGMVYCWRRAWFNAKVEDIHVSNDTQEQRNFLSRPSLSLGLLCGYVAYSLYVVFMSALYSSFGDGSIFLASIPFSNMGAGATFGAILVRRSVFGKDTWGTALLLCFMPVAYCVPGLGITLLGLCLAQALRSRVMAGVFLVYLFVYINFYYYCLQTTLLHKSLTLLAAGMVLLLVVLGVSRFTLRRFEAKDANSPQTSSAGIPLQLRRFSACLLCLLMVGTSAFIVYQSNAKEAVLAQGYTLLLKLRPVDPRSLMQGDYMILDYELDRNLDIPMADEETAWLGYVVLHVSSDGRGEFARPHFGKAEDFVPATPEEKLLLISKKSDPYGQYSVLWQSFFFQEGKGSLFEDAQYAEFRVGHDGTSILVGLVDRDGFHIDAE